MSDFIPVNTPVINGNEKKYLDECITSGWISSEGPFVAEFEKKFSQRIERKYGIAVSNGSAAIEIAIASLGIGKGDEVILPTFTIISCLAPIVRCGATPVLVDCHPNTWNMTFEAIQQKVTKKTKAIIIVHIYGLPVDLDPVLKLAEQNNIKIIEDAAEMHGQTYKDRPCGSFGDISIFSFYPNKHITTGEGGMLVTNDLELADKSRGYRNLCFQQKKRFVHEDLGWNYRITNMQAALGLAQLEKLDDSVQRKRKMGKFYTDILSDITALELPIPKTNYAENIYWVYGIVLRDEVPFDAENAMKKLGDLGIGTRPFFWPMHEQPVFRKMGLFKEEKYPNSERIARRGFYIPSGLGLTEIQMEKVSASIRKIFS